MHRTTMAHLSVKSLSLTAQVHLPALADGKAAALAWYRRTFGRPRCAGLRALRHFDLSGVEEALDVGSANGESAASLRTLAPQARLVAFEPNPFYLNRLRSRFRRDARVSTQGCALSDRDGRLPLHVPAYNYTLFPELATLERREAEGWLTSRILGYDPLRLSILEVPAQSRTLDGLGLNPSLLRIDGRCDTPAVIRGGANTLALCRPIMSVESPLLDAECATRLQSWGYRAFRYEQDRLVRVAWPEPAHLLLRDAHLALWQGPAVADSAGLPPAG